jgi:glycolate oxidase FAD binding subunit
MDAGVSSRATKLADAFLDAVRAIVSDSHVYAAEANDCVAGVLPHVVVEPGNEQELAQVLQRANEAGLAVIPRGGGTKPTWGNPPSRADVVLSVERLDRIIEHAWADLTVTVEAGCTIQKLQETLAPHGQRLALDPLWPDRATVGGVLSTNDSGALRLRFGALRDLVIGVTLALPDGTLARSGGKVVKNVAGYDLPKLATGALGTLGVITRASFRLHPLPKQTRTISCLTRDICDAQKHILAIQDSQLAHSALQVRVVGDVAPQVDVLFEATQAGLAAQVDELKRIVAPCPVIDPGPAVWNARRELYSAAKQGDSSSAVTKISVVPARIVDAVETLAGVTAGRIRFSAVVQGTGIGCVFVEGEPEMIGATLKSFRASLEGSGGSLVVAHHPSTMPALDAWGAAGDALPLMLAVKQQFDPKGTLNPGRFVGGI